jgi:hypothetical protein
VAVSELTAVPVQTSAVSPEYMEMVIAPLAPSLALANVAVSVTEPPAVAVLAESSVVMVGVFAPKVPPPVTLRGSLPQLDIAGESAVSPAKLAWNS